jgi:two-component system response regulator MprA
MADEIKNNKKILVIEEVEDEASLRNALRDKFTLEGFSVLEAKNGEEGLDVALREHPNIILLDIIMPKMDGLTMMKKLREADEWGKKVPIIILTNLSAEDDRINRMIADYEPAYYFVKSDHTMDELLEKIKERLSRPV